MGSKSTIEWTDSTWNPTRGCSVASPGCHNCYARNIAARFSGPGKPYHGFAEMTEHGPQWTGEMALVREHLTDPLRWQKHRRVFVNSMSDLFENGLSVDEIDHVFAVMAICAMHETKPSHTFQILTKRSMRMRLYARAAVDDIRERLARIAGRLMEDGDTWHDYVRYQMPWPLPNVHLGVSIEDNKRAAQRVPDLLATQAVVRFLSVEPQLELIVPGDSWAGLSWIVQGGESGPGARPFDLRWADDMRERCKELGVAYFLKQVGAKPECDGKIVHLRSRKGNDLSELPPELGVRQFPEAR